MFVIFSISALRREVIYDRGDIHRPSKVQAYESYIDLTTHVLIDTEVEGHENPDFDW
jgi:hypothetical protein